MNEQEQTLIDACLSGDPADRHASFEELISPYQDRIYNTLYRFVGNAEDAAELYQDTMIRVFRGMRSYQGESHFYTWMYRIALNVAFSFRRRRTMKAVSIDALNTSRLETRGDEAENRPARAIELTETRGYIERALAEVPRVYRAVLILKDIDGLRYEEIAEILKVPVGTVRSRLHRARADMRSKLRPLLDQGVI